MVLVVRLTGIVLSLVGAVVAQHSGGSGRGGQGPAGSGHGSAGNNRGHGGGHPIAQPAVFPLEFRSIDGHGNNLQNPSWGAAEVAMLRTLGSDYADSTGSPSGSNRASAREISNLVAASPGSILSPRRASDFVWQWGQFLDHDLVETPGVWPGEAFDIAVPLGDAWFDPFETGTQTIPMNRSGYEMVKGVRQQVNFITALIDASNVYGSDAERQDALRTLDGTGRLLTSADDMLPFNVHGLPNAGGTSSTLFLAGDVRANEQIALTAMHTVFVREHNAWAGIVGDALPGLSGDDIYELARCVVAAEMQAITYREFLPVLLGRDALADYRGYRPSVDPGISNAFATAAYRVGHTMLSPQLLRLDAYGQPHPLGPLPLANAFFDPQVLLATGIDPVLRGLAAQRAQAIDPFVVDDVRNFLFGPPGSGGFDLAALNIQRGRDHGLPSYNDMREATGHPRAQRFTDLHPDPLIASRLSQAYASVDDIDPWVGLLAERPAPGALVGRTLRAILGDQFERARDGDRFWYEVYLPTTMVEFVNNQTLAVIIRRNTGIGAELPDDVFRVPQ